MRLIVFAVVATCCFASAQVIFTEYVEGSGHNKALEITNVSDSPYDLAAYRVGMYFNGSEERGQDFTLRGVLAPGESHVFYHHNTGADYHWEFEAAVEAAPSKQSAGFGWFNGDDAIILDCGGEVVDSLGRLGSSKKWGESLTLRRSEGPARTNPKEEWDADAYGWTEHPKDTFDGLGQR
jgi:uncharacterized protein